MKLLIWLFTASIAFAGVYHYHNNSPNKEKKEGKENLYAYDDFFFQMRNYPSGRPDLASYQQAFKTARLDMIAAKNNNNRANGFDLDWVSEGANNIGGRVNAIAVDQTNGNTIYVGTARGGVFKTLSGGDTWQPIFDDQPFLSIGCITIDPTIHNTVYVGTGDPNISGYPGIGDGVYRSKDGGETWEHLGLTEQRVISKIIVAPNDPNVIYVAAMGLPFERNNQRGVYKSTNGGLNWQQILFVSDEAGVIDMVMNPNDPNVLYASSWNRIRNNQESVVEGTDAKVWKTTDGGNNWVALEGGLPVNEVVSRINLAISASNPNIVYAAYVSPYEYNIYNIYKTTDNGNNWQALPLDDIQGAPNGQGWYYSRIYIDPLNANTIYLLGLFLNKSTDGGNTWAVSSYEPHADCHALAFNATSTKIYLGTDGGVYKENNQDGQWTDVEDIPNTQFYRTAYNPHNPQMYYAGAQDNGTIYGNALDANNWQTLYGADGFQPQFDPTTPNRVYAEWQNGGILYSNDGGNGFNDGTLGIAPEDRRSWDMPYIISPHNPNVLYTGTYRVYKSESEDTPNWTPISEDVSDGLVYAPRFHVVSAIDESLLQEGLLYVGTTDANVWVSANGGATWDSIHQNGLPNRYISAIKASKHDVNTVFVTQTGYKDNDFAPHVFKSTNKGLTWVSVSGNLPNVAVNCIYLMPQNKDVFFVGTDAGVYGTINGGETWARLGNNMPLIPVYDLTYNPTTNQLVAATFARSIGTYPLADILQAATGNETVDNAPFEVIVSPNPAKDLLVLQIALPINTSKQTNSTIELYNMQGKLLLSSSSTLANTNLDISHLKAGVYLLKIRNGQQLYLQKIIKAD